MLQFQNLAFEASFPGTGFLFQHVSKCTPQPTLEHMGSRLVHIPGTSPSGFIQYFDHRQFVNAGSTECRNGGINSGLVDSLFDSYMLCDPVLEPSFGIPKPLPPAKNNVAGIPRHHETFFGPSCEHLS